MGTMRKPSVVQTSTMAWTPTGSAPSPQARLTVASTDIGVHPAGSEVIVSVLWHNHDEPTPRILASRFASIDTAAELRTLADLLDGIFSGIPA
jgi:hypothetical protein